MARKKKQEDQLEDEAPNSQLVGEASERKGTRKTTSHVSASKPSNAEVTADPISVHASGISVRFRKKGEQEAPSGPSVKKTIRAELKAKQEKPKRTSNRRTAVKQKPAAEAPPPRKRTVFSPELPTIPTPADAPRIVRVSERPMIVIGNEVIPPFIFFGNPADEQKAETVLSEISRAAAAGVHLHSLMVEFPVDEMLAQDAFDLAAYLLDRVVQADPEARVIFRVVFAGVSGWEKTYPKAAFRYEDGALAEPSVCDEGFWSEARKLLGAFVRGLLALGNGLRILGVHLDRGEWFFADGWGYDTSKAAEESFRTWARWRYGDDPVALQAAWFDGKARFETLRIPEYGTMPLSGESFLRESRKERRWVDYHLFLSDATVACIQRLAHEVKKSSEGRLLVAVSYGYTFEWSHPANGHLSLGKLLRTREVDIICGPPSYKDRHMGGAAAFPGPIDSFALNGKLFISEEDFKTPISKGVEPDDFNPVMATPQALEAAHWRGLGCAVVHGTGIAWMDLWGNGWLDTPTIWQRAKRVREALIKAIATTPSDPDVAVLIDERSIAYLSDQRAFKQLIQDSREAVLRAGVSAGFYLLSDLAHRRRFPEAKLYIFLNAWDTRPEVRAAIKNRLQRDGKTLFWVYAAGQFEHGRPAVERVREITGIAIRPQPFSSRAGTTILNRRHPLTELLEERALSVVDQLEPSFFAIPEEGCTVLGEYTQTGLPSLVVREITSEDNRTQTWRSVFLGEPLVDEKIIRGLCQLAGVQVWNYHGDVVHVRKPHLSIHFSGSGHRTATLPDRWHAYDVVGGEIVSTDATHFHSTATDGATQVLLVGEESEVQRLAELDAETLLTLDTVPEPEPDTLDETSYHEVSLLSLSDAEELAFMFRDQQVEEIENEPTETEKKPAQRKQKVPAKKSSKARSKPRESQSKESSAKIGVRFRAKG